MAQPKLMRTLDSLENTINQRMADLTLAETQVTVLRRRMVHLLAAVGEPGKCTGARCKADVIWVRHLNGKRAPYDLDGANHFSSCPDAATFRR
jgi:hypothetical protein